MTPEQLAEIRARAEAATPGPWEACGEDQPKWPAGACSCGCVYGDASSQLVLEAINGADHARFMTDDLPSIEQGAANALFAAHARTDIPALLDYIEELQWVIRKVGDCVAHPEDTKEVGRTLCAQCMYLVDAITSKEPTNA